LEHRAGGGLGVDRVGLAVAAPGGLVGLVDLGHLDALGVQVAGQRGAVGAGALNPGPPERAEGAGPGGELVVAPRAVGRRRTRRRTGGLLSCGILLAAPTAVLLVRVTGLDAGTPLAVPVVLFPYSAVLTLLVLDVMIAVPALRSRCAVAVVAALVAVHVVSRRHLSPGFGRRRRSRRA
jgi:hypothetical protein